MKQVAILGAAGKMGSGIALLLLQMLALVEGAGIILLEVDASVFEGLKKYLRQHLRRYAERNINDLRHKFSHRHDLVDNADIVEAFVEAAMDKVRYVTTPEECRDANWVFEAIFEDLDLKVKMFKIIDTLAFKKPFYFTNTSSIPIHVLQEKSGIKGRIIGFHFYNPPPVQKLVEIIVPHEIDSSLKTTALEIAKALKKTVVFSSDVAGFIGNGHFLREAAEACSRVEDLQKKHALPQAICMVNSVTQDFLLRPMGFFQLMDYVGLDVCLRVAAIMNQYLPEESISVGLISSFAERHINGGQNPDGTQKDGFFHYEGGRPVAVYDLLKGEYLPYISSKNIGPLPPWHHSWKELVNDTERKEKVDLYFSTLWGQNTMGADLARAFLERSRAIAYHLVKTGVAKSIADVDTVLQQGFYHLYGVERPFLVRSGIP